MWLLLSACQDDPPENKPETAVPTDSEPEDTGTPPIDTGTPPVDTATGDTGTTPPVLYFEPYYVHFTTFYGYDPLTDTARYYWADGSSVAPQIVGILYEAAFLFTEDHAEDACGFTIVDSDTTTGIPSEAWTVESGEHLGFVLSPGSFVVGDYTDPETGMPACREPAFDPAIFGASFVEWASARSWGVGMGELAPETRELLETDPDFAELGEMLAAGQIIGGSVQTDDGLRDASLVLVGYPMDDFGGLDSSVALTADQMWPEPVQGVYTGFLPTWIRTDTLFTP